MRDIFVKKYWEEEGGVLFYLHFQDSYAIRQIEISNGSKLFLTTDDPTVEGGMLYDQSLEDLTITESDHITRNEFEAAWTH